MPIIAVIAAAALLALASTALGLAAGGGWNEKGAGLAMALSARHSFLWFLTAWSASSLAQLWPGGWRATLRRRALGLGFAAAHGVHLGAIVLAALMVAVPFPPDALVGGGAAYVVIAAMALTSNDAAVRRLGARRWQRLHSAGGWLIAAIFTLTYVGRLQEGSWVGGPAVLLLAVALLLRISASIQAARRRERPA